MCAATAACCCCWRGSACRYNGHALCGCLSCQHSLNITAKVWSGTVVPFCGLIYYIARQDITKGKCCENYFRKYSHSLKVVHKCHKVENISWNLTPYHATTLADGHYWNLYTQLRHWNLPVIAFCCVRFVVRLERESCWIWLTVQWKSLYLVVGVARHSANVC